MADKTDAVPHAPSSTQLKPPDCLPLSTDHVAAVTEFVKQVGGVDKARQALAALVKLKEAA